ncbi:MAG: hypothetical protein KAH38_05300 [Candidatus Hydrogenedentes bacterium]|nr:hypothetical protein [Candidatus Hydrogenedentota bacterium]
MAYRGWGRYISVAERREKAKKAMAKLRKKGKNIYPVEIEGRTIARSFWGKGWCQHLESFMDYENRLPRGRTYARNGSICHLDIQPGCIEAKVSGSRIYNIVIKIDTLPKKTWNRIKKACAGRVGTMLELLQGKLSNEVMGIVANRETGLFPKPSEITLVCNCPDWAVMCKHVAAVLYGVGNRLDAHPDLLFLLRNVDAQELIGTEIALPSKGAGEDILAADQISAIFDIDMEEVPPAPASEKNVEKKVSTGTKRKKKAVSKRTATTSRKVTGQKRGRPRKAVKEAAPPISVVKQKKAKAHKAEPKITGRWVKSLRKKYELPVPAFAELVGVSSASIYLWESTRGMIRLQNISREKLLLTHNSLKK